MRHILRAALVLGLATSSAAIAGGGAGQAGSGEAQREYERLEDGYRQTVTTKKHGIGVKVTVDQKGWREWNAARDRQLQQAKAEVKAAEQRLRELEAQMAEVQSQQQQQLSGIGAVQQDERGIVLTLTGGVLFTSGSDELMPQAKERLDSLAQVLQQTPESKFTIEGHTDSKGSADFNQDLSERRAQAVKDYLVSKGINEANIETRGYGEERAVASNDTPEGRANNRRVEVVLPEHGIGGAGSAGAEEEPATQGDKKIHDHP